MIDDAQVAFIATDAAVVESNVMWGVLTTPVHSRQRLARWCVAVAPEGGGAETAEAMIAAGLARWTGGMERDYAPVLEILHLDTWRPLAGSRDVRPPA